MEKEFKFIVKTIEAGQRGSYQDSFYHYEVTSEQPEFMVKRFCMKVIKNSYEKKDMPDPFAGELLEFSKITDNKHPDNIVEAETQADTYRYRVRCLYTG